MGNAGSRQSGHSREGREDELGAETERPSSVKVVVGDAGGRRSGGEKEVAGGDMSRASEDEPCFGEEVDVGLRGTRVKATRIRRDGRAE